MTPSTPESRPDKEFRLDGLKLQFAEFKERHRRNAEDDAWLTEFKSLLKELATAKGAQDFTIRGTPVARLVPGQLNKTLLAKEQPDIIALYTRRVVKEEFDQVAFARELPEMFEQYRAQRFELLPGDSANL